MSTLKDSRPVEIYPGQHHPKIDSQLKVFKLQGHTKALTKVKYNADGDLLFTAAKDNFPCVWYSNNGERLGTYAPIHRGVIWDLDPSWDSQYLLTGGGDTHARVFEVATGKCLMEAPLGGPVRSVAWSEGVHVFATASDGFKDTDYSKLTIFKFPEEYSFAAPNSDIIPKYSVPNGKIELDLARTDGGSCVRWTYANEGILLGTEKGSLSLVDPETGSYIISPKAVHTGRINEMNFNKDKTLLITASKDCHAKLIDPRTLTVVKDFKTDRPVNGAVISPNLPHVIIGGGQDAKDVTTSAAGQGKFESQFYHMAYGDEFGRVKGHFGPINSMAIHPNGDSFATASEDGFARLHHFDKKYLNTPSYLTKDIRF